MVNSKIGIVGVLNNPATSQLSHSAGMVYIVSKLFNASVLTEKDDWGNYSELIIYHGPNFKQGSFNVIGGVGYDVLLRSHKLADFDGKISSLDGFQLREFSLKRKIGNFDNFRLFDKIELPDRENLVIGDSHSVSVWPDETYTISRNDGKTLYGFLKQDNDFSKYSNIIFYFGNIDIRFHLARQSNPIKSTKELFNRYCDYVSKYNSTITQLLPIESELRKIPKSGQYKGVNFFGSIGLRKEMRLEANRIILESKIPNIEWPSTFINDDGELSFNVMEQRQSVHLRPEFYIRNIKKQLKLF